MVKTSPRFKGLIEVGLIVTRPIHINSRKTKAVRLVKHDTDSCKHYQTSYGLAKRSSFVWLQSDWIAWCESGFLEDEGLDRMMLACGSELLGGSYAFDLERVVYTT